MNKLDQNLIQIIQPSGQACFYGWARTGVFVLARGVGPSHKLRC